MLVLKNAIHLQRMVYIADYLPSTVASRQSMQLLDNYLLMLKDNNIILNFENIDFISRAFADELIHFLADNNIKAQFVNTSPAVREILKTVEKNRVKRNKSYHNIAITDIKNKKELDIMLSLI